MAAHDSHRRPSRLWLHTLLMVFVMALCGYMIVDLWDDVRYDLSDQTPIELGRAEGADFAARIGDGDHYVRASGIVSNRGAVIKAGRLGALLRPELWYRQLIGAPVFLELDVTADPTTKERFALFTDVTVEGRGRRLFGTSDYASLVPFFQARFGYKIPDNAVVITVGRLPGGQHRALLACVLLGLVGVINLALFVMVLRRQRGNVPYGAA